MALAALLAVPAWTARAGFIFFPGAMKEQEFVPSRSGGEKSYEVRYSVISSNIKNDRAETSVRETVLCDTAQPRPCLGLFPLMADVEAGSVSVRRLEAGGTSVPVDFQVLTADAAQALIRAVATAVGNADLATFADRPLVLIPVLELDHRTELEITFRQSLKTENGLTTWNGPMPSAAFSAKPVERITLTADLSNDLPLHSIFSATHEVKIARVDHRSARATLSMDHVSANGDLQLHFVADSDPLGLRLVSHRAEGEEDGYFMLIANPAGDALGTPLEKDVVLALDVSGSMRGEKMEQARSAIEYCLDHLNSGDRFNVIAFGTEVEAFRDNVVGRTDTNLEAAKRFVDGLVAHGRTNIDGALRRGLAGAPASGRLQIMIFLTDGTPTAGEQVPEKIVELLPELNAVKASVYVVGVGNDVNAHLLDQIAEQSNGDVEYIAPEEDIDDKVAALYNRLSQPVLSEVHITFGGLDTHSVYPKRLPALFKGGEVMVMGRYSGGGKHTVTLSGLLAGKEKTYEFPLAFAEGTRAADEYVAVLWASRKIGHLLQEVRLHGENQELIGEVVKLSTQFGIITEYTEASVRMLEARQQKGGQWAVNQAYNDSVLKGKTVAASEANMYRDRRGELKRADKIRQVGRKVFYEKEDGVWVEEQAQPAAADAATAAAAPDAPVREISRFSQEYFDLIQKDKDFAQAQALGKEVKVQVGDETILVK
jgi:Ca-activated chloride channel family protein